MEWGFFWIGGCCVGGFRSGSGCAGEREGEVGKWVASWGGWGTFHPRDVLARPYCGLSQGFVQMKTRFETMSALVLIASVGSVAVAGPDWIEDGDAGATIGTAQDTTQAGPIQTIAGTIAGMDGDTEDVYKLVVEDGNDFDNDVMFGFRGTFEFNASMWLFDSQGFGVLGNDDDPLTGGPDARLTVPSTDGVTLFLAPGIYYLAITESGNVPLAFLDGMGLGGEGAELAEIFHFESSTEVSGPDGAGGTSVFAEWSGGAGNTGGYGVTITPTPGSVALLGLGGLFGVRRRR